MGAKKKMASSKTAKYGKLNLDKNSFNAIMSVKPDKLDKIRDKAKCKNSC